MFTIGGSYKIKMRDEAEGIATSFMAIVQDFQAPLLEVRSIATGDSMVINTAAPTFVSAEHDDSLPVDEDIPF
jgi:hypothetical protein